MIRTQMDAGPAKARRRFSAAPIPHTGTILVTGDQLATLWSFWTDSIASGAEAFEWLDPRTGNAAIVRFTELPRVAPRAPRSPTAYWRVELSIEVMPAAVNPARPEDILPPSPELAEWGPWFHALDPAPAGEVDAAFRGTSVPDTSPGGGGDDGGGVPINFGQNGTVGVPGVGAGHSTNSNSF